MFGQTLDPSNTAVDNCSDSFKRDGDFAFVGVFAREVVGSVELRIAKDGGPSTKVGEYEFAAPGDYYYGQWHASALPGLGAYVVTMTLNEDVLATGRFTVIQ